jgi:3-deoxy-D-arabino-heptulosonate 7-phosphate (DAHP) synthase
MQHFEEWILSPFSGGTYSVGPISRHQHQHKIEYTNQLLHKPVKIKTSIKIILNTSHKV